MTDISVRVTKLIYSLLMCFLLLCPAVAQSKTARTAPTAQQHKTTRTAPGVVSGRVFAITKSGDIKPARMATVYLLWEYHSLEEAKAEEKNGIHRPFAELTFLTERNKAMAVETLEMDRDAAANNYWSESKSCSKDLEVFDKAILATMQWAVDQKMDYEVLNANADEEGNFKITGVRAGIYDLIARGRAGFNEAFWRTADVESGLQDIKVAPGMETTVKLASPVKSCLKLGDDN